MRSVICCNHTNSKMTKSTEILNTMNVYGVLLVDERSSSNKLLLGSIILSRNDICGSCINLRQMINKELSLIIPQKYNFLSREGWPLAEEQEVRLKISNIIDDENKTIAIKKTFDKPRIGIVNTNGDCIGFVSIDASSRLIEIRQAINNLFSEAIPQGQVEYLILDKNNWPVLPSQENDLSLVDLIKSHSICIKPKIVDPSYQASCNYSNSYSLEDNKISRYSTKRDLNSPKESDKTLDSDLKRRPKNIVQRANTIIWRKKDKHRRKISKHIIMISYVRNESSLHAIKLKRSLVELGFSVFLDVHEITEGDDWQDVLNEAVNTCQVFIPLITPMYGKTQWTNREVKLADMLNKIIIPINFLEKWPPSCLSIQFATIQVIHWKPNLNQDSEHAESPQTNETSNDIRHWPDNYIQQVSILIAKQTPKLDEEHQLQHKSSFLDRSAAVASRPEDDSVTRSNAKSSNKSKKSTNSQIVISAHPKQKKIADDLRINLEKENYEVWVSTDLMSPTTNNLVSIDYPETPDSMIESPVVSLSTISEITENNSTRVTSSTESEGKRSINRLIDNNVLEKSNSFKMTTNKAISNLNAQLTVKRPTSLPIAKGDNLFFNYERRQIRRLPSQISEISISNNTLTPEKMERLTTFQDKVVNSKLVIILISDAYFRSRTSKNHVYYCEHRKKMLLVQAEPFSFPTPTWFSNLVNEEHMIQLSNPKYLQLVKTRVKRKIDSKQLINLDNTIESKLQFYTKLMKKKLPEAAECCVYFLGTAKPQNQKTIDICKAIGNELAKIKNIVIVTSGYGVGELVAKAFYYKKLGTSSLTEEPNVVHILPHKESKDYSHICKQTKEKSFEELDFGKTLFFGDSMKERDKTVARLLNTCILIEGDLESVYQAEEFIWNDHYVIPVPISGGAANGSFGLPMKVFDLPVGVDETDWKNLSNNKSTPEEIAKSICRIIVNLKKSILNQYYLTLEESTCGKLKKSIKKKRIDDKLEVLNKKLEVHSDNISQGSNPEKVLPVVEDLKPYEAKKRSKWSKMQRYIWLSKRK